MKNYSLQEMLAASFGFTQFQASKVLEQIIEKGVDASADRYLMQTVKNGHFASATVLIKNGADPNYVDPSDNNYLHIAAETEHRQLVPLFAANDVDINAVNAAAPPLTHRYYKREKSG